MTNEELQAHLEALKAAYKAGQIEEWNGCDGSEWREFDGVMMAFTSELFHYRIKPTPREVYARREDIDALDKSPIFGAVAVRYEIAAFGIESAKNLVKFREVLE